MIKDVGEMQSWLNTYSAKDWTKSAELNVQRPYLLNDAAKVNFEKGEAQESFGEFLTDSMAKVNSMQQEANVAIEKLVTGQSKNIHETMLAVEKADIAFRAMNQIRMKVLDAYKEIVKMQI